MTSAAVAGQGAKGRHTLVVAVVVVTAFLVVLNPWLTVFAVLGFGVGWAIREWGRIRAGIGNANASSGLLRRRIRAGIRNALASYGPLRISIAVIGLLLAFTVAVLSVAANLYFLTSIATRPLQRIAVPVSYSATAKLQEDPDAFALTEHITIPRVELRRLSRAAAPQSPADYVTQLLERKGWTTSPSFGDTLKFRREGRKNEAHMAFLKKRETFKLPIPQEVLGGLGLLARTSEVTVDAPKRWVLATTPPSDAHTIASEREQRLVKVEDVDDFGGTTDVELAGPLFRGTVGAWLLGFSLGSAAKWGVLIVFGVFQDEVKRLVRAIFNRLSGRHEATPPAGPPSPLAKA
jgi:hypothetical protein